MTRAIQLPRDSELFEIRFESIGGLGAHAAGQIVASAAVLCMSLNGSHFSSYGSEKKGSVVRSFVRLSPAGRAIRTSAPIETPDVIVVFHSRLLAHPATLAGMRASGTLIYSGHPG
ncbi:MAG: 2-oxoacid:acceptor oxidoreductase family protein, partial [Gammaproteobacteria bacterium]|nr:2-oxoacid:acceptor oxidoreductase family protein [Gammaproteobacteria bacterium]